MRTAFSNLFMNLRLQVLLNSRKILSEQLATGKSSDGTTLADVLESGNYLRAPVSDDMAFKRVLKQVTACAITIIYKLRPVYVVLSDAPNGCHKDDRGPIDLRVCLDAFPNRSAWLYFVPNDGEDSQIDGPPGWKELVKPGGFYNVTMKDIVEASWTSYREHGVAPVEQAGTWSSLKTTDGSTLSRAWALPVCNNPKGEAISNINQKNGRNFPCICGTSDWHMDPYNPAGDESHAFHQATGLFMRKSLFHTCQRDVKCAPAESAYKPFDGDTDKHSKGPFYRCKNAGKHHEVDQKDVRTKDEKKHDDKEEKKRKKQEKEREEREKKEKKHV